MSDAFEIPVDILYCLYGNSIGSLLSIYDNALVVFAGVDAGLVRKAYAEGRAQRVQPGTALLHGSLAGSRPETVAGKGLRRASRSWRFLGSATGRF